MLDASVITTVFDVGAMEPYTAVPASLVISTRPTLLNAPVGPNVTVTPETVSVTLLLSFSVNASSIVAAAPGPTVASPGSVPIPTVILSGAATAPPGTARTAEATSATRLPRHAAAPVVGGGSWPTRALAQLSAVITRFSGCFSRPARPRSALPSDSESLRR